MLEEEMKVKCEFLVERKELSKIIDPHVSRKCLAWGSAPHGVTSADTETPAPKPRGNSSPTPRPGRPSFTACRHGSTLPHARSHVTFIYTLRLPQ